MPGSPPRRVARERLSAQPSRPVTLSFCCQRVTIRLSTAGHAPPAPMRAPRRTADRPAAQLSLRRRRWLRLSAIALGGLLLLVGLGCLGLFFWLRQSLPQVS